VTVRVWRSPKVRIGEHSVAGRGIFATEAIAAGEIVAVKVGHVVDTAEMETLTRTVGDFSLQIHDDVFLAPRTAEEVDDMVVMINHSCDANVGFDGQVTYVAIRDIPVGDELCHDYAMMRTAPYQLECACGAGVCRGVVTHNDWKLPEVQERYAGWFQPHIATRISPTGSDSV